MPPSKRSEATKPQSTATGAKKGDSSSGSSSGSGSGSSSSVRHSISKKKNAMPKHLPIEPEDMEDDDDGDDNDDDDDDDEDDDDDPELDDLVASTLIKFATSKFSSKAEACSSLRNSLMNAGKLKEKRLTSRGGVTTIQKVGATSNAIEDAQRNSALYDTTSLVAPPLKAQKVVKPETVGKGWFDMEPMKMDEKLKRDIKIIQMRNYLDPKRFYKNPDKVGKVLHVGTVIEGPSEYASGRLTNRQRKQTIVEEILGDSQLKDYAKRKYNEIQFEKQNKKKVFKKRKKLRH